MNDVIDIKTAEDFGKEYPIGTVLRIERLLFMVVPRSVPCEGDCALGSEAGILNTSAYSCICFRCTKRYSGRGPVKLVQLEEV